jgi:hypothetical protein
MTSLPEMSDVTSGLFSVATLFVGAAVLVGGADAVAVAEEVVGVPVVLDLQQAGVAVAPVPERSKSTMK